MGERTEHAPGTHSWADLATTDATGAKRFYSGLFGWDLEDMPAGEDRVYTMASIGGSSVAAVYAETDGPLPPHWNCYVTVASADDAAGEVESAGGTVVMGAFDVMEAGRMVVARDPSGAFVSLWEPRQAIGAELVNAHGALCWNDLNTGDPEAAMGFYEKLLGWSFERVEGSPVPYWTIRNGERMNGGVRELGEEERSGGVPSHWLPYFGTESLERATTYVGENDGTVLAGPIPVGGVGTMAVVQDPQGAAFCLYEGQFEN